MEVFGIAVAAFVVGFLMGRKEKNLRKEEEAETGENTVVTKAKRQPGTGMRIASPIDGKLSFFFEGGAKGALIEPLQGKIYAPMSGKIMKVYPMGNALRLRDGEGTELYIRVGRQNPDELCNMFFRPRVVDNEIVNKGKLLLEFDIEGLLGMGEEIMVTVSPENDYGRDVFVIENESVKVGEDLFEIG